MEESKELKIFRVKNTALYQIGFEGGGKLPKILQGKWTSPDYAQKAIDAYYEEQTMLLKAEEQRREIEEEAARVAALKEAAEVQQRLQAVKEKSEAKKSKKAVSA